MRGRAGVAASPRSSLRRTRAVFALPFVFASGCLLIAPPEDLPAPGAGAQGGLGGSAGAGGADLGGTSPSLSGAGGDGDSGGEAGRATSGGTGATGGDDATGGSGAVGGNAQGGSAGRGGSNTGANGGTGGTAGEGGEPGCETNADCVLKYRGQAARCLPDDTCVQLQTTDCPVAYAGEGKDGSARFADPNAIFVGSMVALDPDFPTTSTNAYALELAIDEINSKAGGLPDPDGGPRRPLVLLVCQSDTAEDADVVKRGIAHLAEDVQVQAVVAQLRPDDLYHAFTWEIGWDLVYFNAVAISSSLALQKNNGGLIWTLLGQPKDYAAAYALLLNDVERYVRTERSLAPSDAIKVAFVYTDDAFDADLAQSVSPSLKFNGPFSAESQSVDPSNPDGKYLKVSLSGPNPIPAAVEQIAAFAPDVVISAAADAMITSDGTNPDGVIQRLEAAMPAPRPYYILSPYNAATRALKAVEDVITGEVTSTEQSTSDPTAPGRFLGVSAAAAADPTLQNGFAERFNTRYQLSAEIPGQVDNYYDAVYYLAYATYAASLADDMTGPGISAGMKRLIALDGKPFADGPEAINQVFTALADSPDDPIALSSTLGAPNFNPDTGVRPATPGIFCFKWDAGFETARHFLDVLRYDAENDVFTGNYECLENFAP